MSEKIFTRDELDLIRQWFNAVQDVNPEYLEKPDYALAKRIYGMLDMRIPNSIQKIHDLVANA